MAGSDQAPLATGTAFTDPVDRPVPAPVSDGYPVVIESDACSVFTALTVTGLDPSRPSPRWLTRRLQLAGMRPISLVVDIANHVMLETGQPLHTYDASALSGTVVARQARRGEKLRSLWARLQCVHLLRRQRFRRCRTSTRRQRCRCRRAVFPRLR